MINKSPQENISTVVDRLDEDRWQDPRVEVIFDLQTYELSYKLEAYGEMDMEDIHLRAALDWRGEPQAIWVGDAHRDVWMPLAIDGSGEWPIPDTYGADDLFAKWLRQIVSQYKADKEAS